MKNEKIENVTCDNKECIYNKEGHCERLTNIDLMNRISCKERKW